VRQLRLLLLLIPVLAFGLDGLCQNLPGYQPYAGLQRFEVGVETADIRTGCIGRPGCEMPSFGLGVGAAVNLNHSFAIDGDFLITPQSSQSADGAYGGHALELLGGIRGEIRARHYAFFAKAQPGYFRWSRVITGVSYGVGPYGFEFSYGSRSNFVSDVGAGMEYSPSRTIHIRGEVSDLVYRYGGNDSSNYLQPSIGVYYGLGKPMDAHPRRYDAAKTHPFFDGTNELLLTVTALAAAADGITTQHFIAAGVEEGDPLARPLVKYGWSGQIAALSLELGAETAGMYAFHRLGLHWVERALPVGLSAIHGYLAYSNAQISLQKH
jgi:hypothetical protein